MSYINNPDITKEDILKKKFGTLECWKDTGMD